MQYFKKHRKKYVFFAALGVLAAAGNTAVIFLVNQAISGYMGHQSFSQLQYFYYFTGALLLFFSSRWLVSSCMVNFMQQFLRETRLRVMKLLVQSMYQPVKQNKEKIYTALTRDTTNVVNASVNIVDLLTNTIIVLLCFGYMAWLSPKLLLCTAGLLVATLGIYAISQKRATALFDKAMQHDDRFIRSLNEILSGIKEVVMARNKGREIVSRHVIPAVDAGVGYNKKALVFYLNNRIVGQMAFYVFIGVLLIAADNALGVPKPTLVNFIFVLLYIWGPIETIVLLIPGLSQARLSFGRIQALEQHIEEEQESKNGVEYRGFQQLQLQGIGYSYEARQQEEGFAVGPVDFTLRQGEIVFIYGGNGSGKTTFINVLCGLYQPAFGEIVLDGKTIPAHDKASYRSLYATVFADFHLFEECYGIALPDEEKIQEYLRLFELEDKVSFNGKGFTSIDLSTGQRKRLALIQAMLEKKPVLVLDEFAADQDPLFRRKFYTEILEYIRAEGFSVVAITHDDAYHDCADTIYYMDYGSLRTMKHKELASLYSLS